MSKPKDKWWWNLLGTTAGFILLTSCLYNYDKFIEVDHNDKSKARGISELLAFFNDLGGKSLVVIVLVVFIILTLWWAYKDYKKRFDDD